MRINNTFYVLFILCGFSVTVHSQTLLDKLDQIESISETPDYTAATFKATRLSIGHSVETRKKNALEISLMTRYWNTPQQTSNSFAADRMSARLGVDYAFSDRFTFGGGHSLPNGVVDIFGKYRLLRQRNDGNGSPLGLTILQTATYRSRFLTRTELRNSFSDKLAFTTQMLVAKKITSNFSLQISPTFIHRNSSRFAIDDDNHFAIGFGGRYKVGHHVSVVSEYYYLLNELESVEGYGGETFGAFALGVNWEVSDLMLQFKLTNNAFFTEDNFITQTRKNFNFKDGNLFFGFAATYFIQL